MQRKKSSRCYKRTFWGSNRWRKRSLSLRCSSSDWARSPLVSCSFLYSSTCSRRGSPWSSARSPASSAASASWSVGCSWPDRNLDWNHGRSFLDDLEHRLVRSLLVGLLFTANFGYFRWGNFQSGFDRFACIFSAFWVSASNCISTSCLGPVSGVLSFACDFCS